MFGSPTYDQTYDQQYQYGKPEDHVDANGRKDTLSSSLLKKATLWKSLLRLIAWLGPLYLRLEVWWRCVIPALLKSLRWLKIALTGPEPAPFAFIALDKEKSSNDQ